ncbi:MAG: tyrosinase family protein, partial [Acidimicrobiales bacterium]
PDLSDVLPGVDSTVKDSLHISELGYDYAADSYVFPTSPSTDITRFRSAEAGVPARVLGNHRRAVVRLHSVRQPEQSFIVRVFLNLPHADTSTAIDGNPHYAGYFALFGHGPCIGGPGHCEPRPLPRRPFDKRPPHHNEPWNVRFDVTDTVATLTAQGATDLQVNLVVLSLDGTPAQLRMDAVSIAFED